MGDRLAGVSGGERESCLILGRGEGQACWGQWWGERELLNLGEGRGTGLLGSVVGRERVA